MVKIAACVFTTNLTLMLFIIGVLKRNIKYKICLNSKETSHIIVASPNPRVKVAKVVKMSTYQTISTREHPSLFLEDCFCLCFVYLA